MKILQADQLLRSFSDQKRAYKTHELGRLFQEQGETLRSTIRRMVAAKLLMKIARDLYWLNSGSNSSIPPLEEIACALRQGEFNFIGLESAASLWGIISQIPVDRLTVVTTGREGEFQTPFGVIEFVHTSTDANEILHNTVEYPEHALRLATKKYTAKGLVKSRRSIHLIDWEEVENDD